MSKSGLTGKPLHDAINANPASRIALIEGLLYENSVLMVSADPGLGKSTIVACAMAQASAGLPVFGYLTVPRPILTYYIPFERGSQEILERLKHMASVIPMDYENIILNENFMGLNVIDSKHADLIIEIIHKDIGSRKLDLIVLDPIYSAVSGGLSSDEKASMFTRFSTRLQAEFHCSNWLNHHTVKTSYTSTTGEPIEKSDPFYGSQWLKAHCTAAYYMKENPKIEGVSLINKKDSHGNLLKEIPLTFEPETYTSFMPAATMETPVKDRLLMFYRTIKKSNKSVTFGEIKGCLMGVSHSHLRRVLETPPYNTAFTKSKSIGKSTLYTPTADL